MDSYLEIAHKVLSASRRPMTAKGILDAAYKARIVPEHLYGKTQHKTLQARLSEDILHHRSSSQFFRTRPGYFFLSELISDPAIPDNFKEPFPARRRTRDLQRGPTLAFEKQFLVSCRSKIFRNWEKLVKAAESEHALSYVHAHTADDEHAVVWTFSLVRRDSKVLSYRIGRYRDDRDTFANRRTVGFPGVVSARDRTLFSVEDYGVRDNALEAVLTDLDLSLNAFKHGEEIGKPAPIFVLQAQGDSGKNIILVILEWKCPDWYEPTTKRLSLNDPSWLDLKAAPNNLDDFEPWSLAVIEMLLKMALKISGASFHKLGKDSFSQIRTRKRR